MTEGVVFTFPTSVEARLKGNGEIHHWCQPWVYSPHVAHHMPFTALSSEVPRDLIFSPNGSVWVTCEALRRWWPIYLGRIWGLEPKWEMLSCNTSSLKAGDMTVFSLLPNWCWNWSSSALATWCEELAHWERPWCWERLRARGEGGDRMRWLNGIIDTRDMSLSKLLSSEEWRTGKPGMPQSIGSQRFGRDLMTEQQQQPSSQCSEICSTCLMHGYIEGGSLREARWPWSLLLMYFFKTLDACESLCKSENLIWKWVG